MQKTITLVWELGGGLAHLYRLSTFGFAFHKAGYKITYVVPNQYMQALSAMQTHADFILPSPILHTPDPLGYGDAVNYSEILSHFSYTNSDQFNSLIKQWDEVLTQNKTELIISDYSPSAVFMSKCLNIPNVMVGSGFACPAIEHPMPVFISVDRASVSQRILTIENLILQSLNKVLKKHKQQILNTVGEMFSDVIQTYLCTHKSLDHYSNRKLLSNHEYTGPIGNISYNFGREENIVKPFLDNKDDSQVCIFVYLDAHYPRLKNVLAQLSDLNARIICYCPNVDEYIKDHYQNSGFYFSDKPLDMNALLPHVDLLVHHGGINLSNLAMMHGKPQCLLPAYVEQQITAENLHRHRLGWMVEPDSPKATLKKLLQTDMQDAEFRANLQAQRIELAKVYNEIEITQTIVEKVSKTLN